MGHVTYDGVIDGLQIEARLTPNPSGRLEISELRLHGRFIRAVDLRRLAIGEIERAVNASTEDSEPLKPLRRRSGESADDFYQLVAGHYRRASTSTRHPAKSMAEQARVPVTTVHRWIREARARGALPSAVKGKVG